MPKLSSYLDASFVAIPTLREAQCEQESGAGAGFGMPGLRTDKLNRSNCP